VALDLGTTCHTLRADYHCHALGIGTRAALGAGELLDANWLAVAEIAGQLLREGTLRDGRWTGDVVVSSFLGRGRPVINQSTTHRHRLGPIETAQRTRSTRRR